VARNKYAILIHVPGSTFDVAGARINDVGLGFARPKGD